MKTRVSTRAPSTFHYGWGTTEIGPIWVVWSEKGLCAVRQATRLERRDLLGEMSRTYPHARLVEDADAAGRRVAQINEVLTGRLDANEIPLDLAGTAFRRRVWREMLRVPRGRTCSYSQLARRAGRPRAVRAAASACAHNAVPLVIPCHRIVCADGSLGGFGWGLECKQKLLDLEAPNRPPR